MQKQINLEDLSFIKINGNRREFWIHTDSSDFASAVESGKKQAIEYLNYLNSESATPILASIVRDIASPKNANRLNQGQLIGFFATLELAFRPVERNNRLLEQEFTCKREQN